MMPTQTSLSAEDNATLEKSWIDSATSAAWGLARMTSTDGAEIIGHSDQGDYAGIAFPVYWPGDGSPKEYHLRRDHPDYEVKDGKLKPKQKYMAPPGRGNRLLFGPGESAEALTDAAVTVLLVEGLKKIVAAWRLSRWESETPRFLAVGLSGVWNFRGTIGKTTDKSGARVDVKGTIPNLDRLTWAGRVVSIAFDSDTATNPSVSKARAVLAAELRKRGALVALLDLQPLDNLDKTGLDDSLAVRGPQAVLDWMAASVPEAMSKDDTELVRLSRLSTLDYGRERKGVAKSMGVNVSCLDASVGAKRREDRGDTPLILLDTVEPADEPVDGAALAEDLVLTLRRFIVLDDAGFDAMALWVLWSYGFELWDIAPILTLLSPEKRCGKTTALSVLKGLLDRSLHTSNTSPAAIFRLIEAVRPTLIIDELDSFMSTDEALRGILNSGHTKAGAQVIRCDGEQLEVKAFSTWCPKVLAAIGELPDTVIDRSIVLHMKRKLPGESVERLRWAGPAGEVLRSELSTVAGRCKRWIGDHSDTLTNTHAQEVAGLSDRAADNWLPLLSIASALGGAWPGRAAHAATALSGGDVSDTDSTRGQLLEDIRDVVDTLTGAESIWSQDLCDRLVCLTDRPWSDFRHGKPLTPNQLARQLKPFGVCSRGIRQSGVTKKGYPFEDLAETFQRYLPPRNLSLTLGIPLSIRHADTTRSGSGDTSLFQSDTETMCIALKNGPNPALGAECVAVSVQNQELQARDKVSGLDAFPDASDCVPVEVRNGRKGHGAGQVVVQV